MGNYVVGVDLGGTKIHTALADSTGRLAAETVLSTGPREVVEPVLENILHSIEQVIRQAGANYEKVTGIGMGAPGPLDAEAGVVIFAPNLNWRSVPLKELVASKTRKPVFLENDANLAALGEYTFGAGQNVSHLIYVTVSTGIGGGIVDNGKIYRGTGSAGEIGHLTLEPGGPVCSCGNQGCLEVLASGTAIAREAVSLVKKGHGKGLLAAAGGRVEELNARVVAEAAHSGDEEAHALYEQAGRYLGIALANLINLLCPELIVIGGGVAEAGDLLLAPARAEASRRALPGCWEKSKIVPAALGKRAGVYGAVALALEGTGLGFN